MKKLKDTIMGLLIGVGIALLFLPVYLLVFTNDFKTGEIWETDLGTKTRVILNDGIPRKYQTYSSDGKLQCEASLETYKITFRADGMSEDECINKTAVIKEDWNDGFWDTEFDVRLWIFKFKKPGF